VTDDQLLRYSRHILLDEFGIQGQERLLNASALIVGAGGLGSPVAMYLAAAGVGRIVLVDGDEVDLTNLQRQILHSTLSIGQPKVQSGKRTLTALNPQIEIVALRQRLQAEDFDTLVAQTSVAIDCSDNFATRHALNRACVAHRKPLVSGAAIRFDGQLTVFDARRADSPCYNCLFPQSDAIEEAQCATMGVLATLTGIVGTMQAGEAIKLIAQFGEPLVGKLLMINALDAAMTQVRYSRVASCGVCGAAN
jgi:molybdopterin-synthase adenylyltransferase